MATATDKGHHVDHLDHIDDVSVGIEPVPAHLRRLRAFDVGILWGDLAVGILVLAAGALLVTPVEDFGLGLGFGPALGAIAVGSLAGSLLLALVAAAGHERAVPTMVLLRPVLGRVGSYGASALNVAQLVGWTSFELWAMALFANRVSDQVFGLDAYGLWLAVVAVACTTLALVGPVKVVRLWLEKVGAWVVLGACGYLTVYLLVQADWGELFRAPAGGGRPFGVAVDLVIALPVSWLPLVADYNRFAASRRQSFTGTLGGFGLGNAWFFALGALLVLAGGLTDPGPAGIAAAILGLAAGAVVGTILLLALLGGESDEAWADIYSAAVSVQNVFPRVPQRALMVGVAAVSTALAAVVTLGDYESFLFLLGSVFIPLFGVMLGSWAGGGLRSEPEEATGNPPRARPLMIAAWAMGFVAYCWALPPYVFLPGWWVDVVERVPGALEHSSLGASLPAFTLSFLVALVVENVQGRRRNGYASRTLT